MKYSIRTFAALVIGSFLALTGAARAEAESIKISFATWVGYGPLYIAREKGFFKQNGVDVELLIMEDPKVRFPAMMAGQIDIIATSLDAAALYLKRPGDFKYFLAMDDSRGGDGIVANKSIASIADLKGKQIGLERGSVAEFYLNSVMAGTGLSESDVKIVNVSAGDAGSAFVAQRVDAAVTYEPWLSRAKATDHGHVLIDTSSTPGLISDALVANTNWLEKHRAEVAAIVRSWNQAVEYYETHPEESIEIMTKGVGGWLKESNAFKESLKGVQFYDAARNKAFFGTPENPGQIHQIVGQAIDIWSRLGKLRVDITPADMIDSSFVNQ